MEPKRKALCFRVEDQDGQGIYRTPLCDRLEALDFEAGGMLHPNPRQDWLLKDQWIDLVNAGKYQAYYFGFSDISQLKRWFFHEETNQIFHDAGVQICIYQTDDYFIGDTQMIFRKATAKLIGKADLI